MLYSFGGRDVSTISSRRDVFGGTTDESQAGFSHWYTTQSAQKINLEAVFSIL